MIVSLGTPATPARPDGICTHTRGGPRRRTRRGGRIVRGLAVATLLGIVPASLGCMLAAPYVAEVLSQAPVADSATVALWSMDEPSGDRVADSGPYGLSGTAGIDARADFGRFQGARLFTSSIESFIYVPYAPVMETGRELAIEAWLMPQDYSTHEISIVIERWEPQANEQSWLLGVVGKQPRLLTPTGASPSTFRGLVGTGTTGQLVFAFQPAEASAPLAFFSSEILELDRWTHVAVSYNGDVVRFYMNGRLDSQYATQNHIRTSPASILIGNDFDPSWLTDFGGRLGIAPGFDTTPYYAFLGRIDELRISRVARTEFVGLPPEKKPK